MIRKASVGLVGDAGASHRPQAAQEALAHASQALDIKLELRWFETEGLVTEAGVNASMKCSGIWVVPGSPYKSLIGVLEVIRAAREQGKPLLGTCAGFQHLILEYVRNVMGFTDAVHAEYDPQAPQHAISRMTCSLVGRRQVVRLDPNSQVAGVYDRAASEEEFHCNYGVNPEFVTALGSTALRPVGWDPAGELLVVELSGHPFFIGTLFIPQYSSSLGAPHPLVCGFLKTTLAHSLGVPVISLPS